MIDLSQKYDSECCTTHMTPKDKVSYPTFYFTSSDEIEFPDEGTATIKFRKIKCSEDVRDPEKPKYSYDLEVHGIDVKGMKKESDPEDDDIGKKAMKNMDMVMLKKKESY